MKMNLLKVCEINTRIVLFGDNPCVSSHIHTNTHTHTHTHTQLSDRSKWTVEVRAERNAASLLSEHVRNFRRMTYADQLPWNSVSTVSTNQLLLTSHTTKH